MPPAENLKNIVEAALLASGGPLSLDALQGLFTEDLRPDKPALRKVLAQLAEDYDGRGVAIVEVSSGWRVQVRTQYASWVSRLWEEKPARYSRALMETLALIAYRQPITRSEIEEIRGVSVSTNIVRSLLERGWVTVVGTRDVPGRPSLYATTKTFLDYFGLRSLDALPTLAEIRDFDEINRELNLPEPEQGAATAAAPLPYADAESESEGESGHVGGDEAESGATDGDIAAAVADRDEERPTIADVAPGGESPVGDAVATVREEPTRTSSGTKETADVDG